MADLSWASALTMMGGGSGEGANGIALMEINSDGELVVHYTDGSVKTVGRVRGADGKIYVPHIDEHKVLTFTLENSPGEAPPPTDLNPFDEWSDIGDAADSGYIWEEI